MLLPRWNILVMRSKSTRQQARSATGAPEDINPYFEFLHSLV